MNTDLNLCGLSSSLSVKGRMQFLITHILDLLQIK